MKLSHIRLREVLHYDPETGIFIWKVRINSRIVVGGEAGSVTIDGGGNPVRRISVDGQRYLSHRLAWFYVTGEIPTLDVDHRDLNPLNNRFKNLREATGSQNNLNRCVSRKNKLGVKGVSKCFNRFRAQFNFGGEVRLKKSYETLDEAKAAYDAESAKFGGEFARA